MVREYDGGEYDEDDIYRNVHIFNIPKPCTRADVLRVSMDAFTWIVNQFEGIRGQKARPLNFNEFGELSLFGLQVVREPLFPSMTYRIEGGCQHSGHLSPLQL